ncbi:MAG: hypothetical protein ABIH92_05685 [Nanoarchaeota archaeon]
MVVDSKRIMAEAQGSTVGERGVREAHEGIMGQFTTTRDPYGGRRVVGIARAQDGGDPEVCYHESDEPGALRKVGENAVDLVRQCPRALIPLGIGLGATGYIIYNAFTGDGS